VHGVLDEKTDTPSLDTARREMSSIMERLHVLIIGPGLGRSAYMQSCARAALELARSLDIGVVVDADGLWLLNSEPGLVKGLEGRIVLTPNVMEFKRLATAVVSTDG
jgi:ATP-dependent NAD(P)H-hydrate dehydratase